MAFLLLLAIFISSITIAGIADIIKNNDVDKSIQPIIGMLAFSSSLWAIFYYLNT